jgi:hypothetical protein
MGKIALLALMGVLVGAGLPAAAEPAAGDAPTTRQRPDHRPALTDTAKAAAVLKASFREQGLSSATLSVTASNERAHRLYERLGFSVQRAFAAHAWARPPAAIELSA